MTDANETPAAEPATEEVVTFVCLGCLKTFPETQRHADDEPFCGSCHTSNQQKEEQRQAELQEVEDRRLAQEQEFAERQAAGEAEMAEGQATAVVDPDVSIH